MRQVTSHYGQSLLDIAIQEYGSIEALFQLAKDNNMEVDAELVPGTELGISETPLIADAELVDYFKKNGYKINQGLVISDPELLETNDDEPFDIEV